MSKSKRILLLPLVFVPAVIVSFFIREPFQRMVRSFYRAFTHGRIYFFGKYTRFFPTDYFIFSFGIFCVLVMLFLYRHTLRGGLYRALAVLGLFFLYVAVHAYIAAQAYLVSCTACKGNRRPMGYGQIKYDNIFVTALAVALLPLLVGQVLAWVKGWPAKRVWGKGQLV